jgi:hypothetical protein
MSRVEPVDPRGRLAITQWPPDAPRGSVTTFCLEHKISRETFYAIRRRAAMEGPAAGLEPRSRRRPTPRTSPPNPHRERCPDTSTVRDVLMQNRQRCPDTSHRRVLDLLELWTQFGHKCVQRERPERDRTIVGMTGIPRILIDHQHRRSLITGFKSRRLRSERRRDRRMPRNIALAGREINLLRDPFSVDPAPVEWLFPTGTSVREWRRGCTADGSRPSRPMWSNVGELQARLERDGITRQGGSL